MKASKQFIEMLTHGRVDFDAVAQVLGVSRPTAYRICQGESFHHGTAMKIAAAFPDVSARQLFRRPFKPFEACQRLLRDELKRNGSLSPEAKRRIQHKFWKLSNPSRVKAQAKAYQRRARLRLQLTLSRNQEALTQRRERYGLVTSEAA